MTRGATFKEFKEKDFIRVCKLEKGEEKEYDACNLINPDPDKAEF